MSHTAEITLGERTGKRVVVVCGECGRPTEHEVLVDVDSYDKTPDDDIQFWDNYLTIQCRGCRTLSFCIESSNTEDTSPEGDQLITTRTLFPGRIAGRPPLRDLHYLPWDLRKVYDEARSALMQDLSVLTGIGIRAIVETVCNEKEAPGRNLAQMIEGLVTLNLITQAEANILHDLRFMGNEAAHKVKAHTQEELNLAFDVVEHLLKTVYLLPEQTKHLPSQTRRPSSVEEDEM